MSEIVSGINHEILKWARLKSGFAIEDIAENLKKKPSIIESWERGKSAPTYVQLEKLAYNYYKRPIALFFFPEPPDESDPKKSFRTLPEFELENLASDTLYAIRQGEAMQVALRELNDGKNISTRKIFEDIKLKPTDSISNISILIREYFGVEIEEQKAWKNYTDSLSKWRSLVEDSGIFIFKRSFKQKDISGFCLLDDEFPIIYLNNSTSKSRQIFTIFHELSHILLNTNGITKNYSNYIKALSGEDKKVEIFCNSFASEFLVPSADFDKQLKESSVNDKLVKKLAERYYVSREVILRKLLDKGFVTKELYESKSAEWDEEFYLYKKESSGGNYYATQFTYLGEKFLNLAFSKYYTGRFSVEQLADYLNIKVKSIPGIEHLVLNRKTS